MSSSDKTKRFETLLQALLFWQSERCCHWPSSMPFPASRARDRLRFYLWLAARRRVTVDNRECSRLCKWVGGWNLRSYWDNECRSCLIRWGRYRRGVEDGQRRSREIRQNTGVLDLSQKLVTFHDYLRAAAFLLVVEAKCLSSSSCRVAEENIRPLEGAFDLRILSFFRLQ